MKPSKPLTLAIRFAVPAGIALTAVLTAGCGGPTAPIAASAQYVAVRRRPPA